MTAQANSESSHPFKIIIFSDRQSKCFMINRCYIEMILKIKIKKSEHS